MIDLVLVNFNNNSFEEKPSIQQSILQDFGVVFSISDGVAKAIGLNNVQSGEVLENTILVKRNKILVNLFLLFDVSILERLKIFFLQ